MNQRSEWQKMLAGELYRADDPALTEARGRARRLMRRYNQSDDDQPAQRDALLRELVGTLGERAHVEPPFYCDYGSHIHAGDGLYMNFGCVVLDCAEVRIGRNAFLAPYVQLYTAHHPIDAAERNSGCELASPITIGDDVWLGGGVMVCPGVSIGDRCVIGAGSVVTRDVPSDVVAAGNPCRVLRQIEPR